MEHNTTRKTLLLRANIILYADMFSTGSGILNIILSGFLIVSGLSFYILSAAIWSAFFHPLNMICLKMSMLSRIF